MIKRVIAIAGFIFIAATIQAQEVNKAPQPLVASSKNDTTVSSKPQPALMEKKEVANDPAKQNKKGHNTGTPELKRFESKPEEE